MEFAPHYKISSDRLYANMSNIIKYIRISRNLNQLQMAQILECSRSKASRIENGILKPEIHQWHAFTLYFDLSMDCYLHGNINFNAPDDLKAFGIHAPYSNDQYSSGILTNAHIYAFKKVMDLSSFQDFCQKEGVDPLYFLNVKNPMSLNFNLRLIETLVKRKLISTQKDLRQYCRWVIRALENHPLAPPLNKNQGLESIFSFLSRSSEFEKNHDYEVYDYTPGTQLIFRVKPREHVDMRLYRNPFLAGVFCDFINYCFLEMGAPDIDSQKISCTCAQDHSAGCIYKFTPSIHMRVG